ncbi:MAG: T9SS type A sorting domain-containing protein [Bacteroidales bacterium]|nr:T9SS type A sorting domain-containing protein [Bacteroidales bacterium]
MKRFFSTLIIIALAIIPSASVVAQSEARELTNLVVFVRFADEPEINHSFAAIDTMFNAKTEGYLSVYNFFKALSYDKIHYNTIYTNDIQNGQIVSYQDVFPRGYFEPYSAWNPIGYQGENPFMGVSMREALLLGRIVKYVDSLHLVDSDIVLDGDGDGDIDNISFIVKGGTGEWASILWPHMEYFPHDSLGYVATINGIRLNTFNLEFEGASSSMFNANVFRHEMGHSLNLPDLYHYLYYSNVSPAGSWDMMDNNYYPNHTAAIYKNKILHVSDDPIEITEDGDYTLLSVGSSPSQNCYYIKSHIDPTQWYVLEYRTYLDLFDYGVPGIGLVVARWNDTIPLDYNGMFANAFFDFHTQAHQYWIFRPGSAIDTIHGSLANSFFSQESGRTSFGPTTNPHPYLTDGTPETSFEITNIQEDGNQLTFHVHFLDVGIEDHDHANDLKVWPNPAHDLISVEGEGINRVEMYDATGRLAVADADVSGDHCTLSVSQLPKGLYILKVYTANGFSLSRKVVLE